MKKVIKTSVFLAVIVFIVGIFFSKGAQKKELVLGVANNNSQNAEELSEENGLNLNTAYASGFLPVRKSDFYDLKIWAGSSVAIDVDSGTLLHYDNGREKTQIASLTKMMTAVLAVENIRDLDKDVVTITKEAIYLPGTTVGCPTSVICNSNTFYAGEKVRAMDLLKAMLMNSANDAAYSLAVHIAGSEENFVEMMNTKAKSLGLEDTHFCTASGLEIDGKESECYSSAYDVARIAAYSLRYDLIWNIMQIPDGRFYSIDGSFMHELRNTDVLLDQLPNCLGGKTGFTPLAGKSLMLAVTDPTKKHKVVMVILNDPDRWEDMRTLNNWVFENYEWQ